MNPILLYHGSNVRFDSFDESKIEAGEGSNLFGAGFYLTDNIEIAKFYTRHVAKKKYITGYNFTGIFKSPLAEFSPEADQKAEGDMVVNSFLFTGNALDAESYIITEELKEVTITAFVTFSGFDRQSAEHTFEFLRTKRQTIHHYRGELDYIIKQLGFADKRIVSAMVTYIRSQGYNAIKYPSNPSFEAENINAKSYNYIVFEKIALTSHKEN